MRQDFRNAVRGLLAAPSFTAAAVATVAIAIAVNTIAFTLLDALLFRPMPVGDASRVVRVYPVDDEGRQQNLFSYPDYMALAGVPHGIEGAAAYMPLEVTAGGEAPREALAYLVSSTYFPLLGIPLTRGRAFSETEESEQDARVAVISHALWERQFAAAEGALGASVVLNGQTFTIVGIGPSRFMGTEPLQADVWLPLAAGALVDPGGAGLLQPGGWLLVVARLSRGVSPAEAEASLSSIARRLPSSALPDVRTSAIQVAPGTFFTPGPGLQPVIRVAFGLVLLVLLIACANVANLVLTRATARQRVFAIRLALGASRGRIARLLLAEGLILAVFGGLAGLLLSAWTLRLLYPVGVSLLPFSWATIVLDLSPDARVFAYTLALSLAAGALFGLAPLAQISVSRLAAGLRDQSTWLGARVRVSRVRQALVVIQLAVCLMLLAGAAVAARSLQRTQALDLGFSVAGVVYTKADVRRHHYSGARVADLYARLSETAARVPGVADVAITTHVPLTGGVVRANVSVEGIDAAAGLWCTYTRVSPPYFRTLGISVVEGRTFTVEEGQAGAPSAVISEALARRFWPGSSALGKRVTVTSSRTALTIVGVVRDATDVAIWREKEVALYTPAAAVVGTNLHLLVRTTGNTETVAAALRAEARRYDPDLLFQARPLADVLRLWMLPSQVAAATAALLGALALSMAAIGLSGVIAYAVSQRTREIGVRMALGADRRDIRTLIIRESAALVAWGLSVGLVGAALASKVMTALLPGAAAADPVPLAAAAGVLVVAAMAACYLPARTAAGVDPLVALRTE